jgi:hypothetical protein
MNSRQVRRVTRDLTDDERSRLKTHRELIARELSDLQVRDQMRKEARDEATLSGELRRAVHASELSLTEISARIGIAPIALDEFLTGERTLRSDVIDRLAGVLGFELQNGHAITHSGQQLRETPVVQRTAKTKPARAGSAWTHEEIQRLICAFEEQVPVKEIAAKHGRTRGAILSRLMRLGKLAPVYGTGHSSESSESSEKWWKREGRTQAGKAWTPEEDKALLRDFDTGMSVDQIAVRLGRGVRAVEVRLVKLGKQPSSGENDAGRH